MKRADGVVGFYPKVKGNRVEFVPMYPGQIVSGGHGITVDSGRPISASNISPFVMMVQAYQNGRPVTYKVDCTRDCYVTYM